MAVLVNAAPILLVIFVCWWCYMPEDVPDKWRKRLNL
jgi:hypothetical protein